jgi:16S rRNA (cytidine1402-2'-O)-methyltransferase
MTSALKILATPIGNIRDITLRALDELKAADIILAEDTRHTKALIKALNITLKDSVRLISCDSRREEHRSAQVLRFLEQNLSVVLVSDAGTPALSDPGSLLVQAVVRGAGALEVIPGASALTAALMGAGVDTTRFAFLGFLPQKKQARKRLIESASCAELALIFYESPLRVQALLNELHELLGPRRVVVARELTKIYETFHRGTLGEILSPALVSKGECVVIVEAQGSAKLINPSCEQNQEIISIINKSQESSKDLVLTLVKKYKLKKKSAYDLVLSQRRHNWDRED